MQLQAFTCGYLVVLTSFSEKTSVPHEIIMQVCQKSIGYKYEASQVAQQVKNPPASAGDTGLFPGQERSPGEENGNPLQCSCLENPIDRGALHRVSKSGTQLITAWDVNVKVYFQTLNSIPLTYMSTLMSVDLMS